MVKYKNPIKFYLLLCWSVIVTVCLAGAELFTPEWLQRSPGWADYCDRIAQITPSVDEITALAPVPHVTRLVLSMAWPLGWILLLLTLWAVWHEYRYHRQTATAWAVLGYERYKAYKGYGRVTSVLTAVFGIGLLLGLLVADFGPWKNPMSSLFGYDWHHYRDMLRWTDDLRLNAALTAVWIVSTPAVLYGVLTYALFFQTLPLITRWWRKVRGRRG